MYAARNLFVQRMGSWKEETKSLLIAIAQSWHVGGFQETCVSWRLVVGGWGLKG